MILSSWSDKKRTQADIAAAAGWSDRSIRSIASNLRRYGTTKAPPNGVEGRRRKITPPMLEALLEHLIEKPRLYQDEMAVFLCDEFGIHIKIPCISKTLKSIRWSKKASRHIAQDRNDELRDFYLHNLSEFRSYHLVYVVESGCDKRIGFR
jgi:transposase